MRGSIVLRSTAFALLTLFAAATAAYGWGDDGHRVVGQIGDDRIAPATRQAISALIGERRLAQIATWPDFIRSEKPWDFAKPWHFATVEDGEALAAVMAKAERTPEPDNVVEAIGFFAAVLGGDAGKKAVFEELMRKNKVKPLLGSTEATALSFLVHFVGDLHQPLHVGRGGDRGGNQISVNWFDEVTNLHSLWDSGLIEKQGLSFTELADFTERELGPTAAQWRGTGPEAWAQESIDARWGVYEIWDRTSRTNFLPELGYVYAHDQHDLLQRRLFQGGVRLAELLDAIFGGSP